MWSFDLFVALRRIESAMPLIAHRLLFCLGIAFGFLFATLFGAGTGFAIGASLADSPAPFAQAGAVLGFSVFAGLLRFLRIELLHGVWLMIPAYLAHSQGALPKGWKLVEHFRARVHGHLPQLAELATLQARMDGALAAFPVALGGWTGRGPTLDRLIVRVLAVFSRQAAPLVWVGVLRGSPASAGPVVLKELKRIAGQWPGLLIDLAWLNLFGLLAWLATYLLLRISFAQMAAVLPIDIPFWVEMFALIIAWVVKGAFMDSLAVAALTQRTSPAQARVRGWEGVLAACPDLAELEPRKSSAPAADEDPA